MNSIRNFFGGGGQGNPMNWMQQFQQFSQNPIAAMMNMRNLNIPPNFNGTPQELVQYLMNTGQMSQAQYQQLSQMANQMQNMMPKR